MHFFRTAAILAVYSCSVGAIPAVAQASSQEAARQAALRGVVSGIVVDPSGARVPHAGVRITGDAESLDVRADGYGHFSSSVARGSYTLTVSAPGFDPASRNGVAVAAGGQIDLSFTLRVAERAEELDVPSDSRSSTDSADNKSAIVFDERRLAELSDDNATMEQELLAMSGGDPSHATDVYVDGFTGGRFPPKSSIREVRINQNPYSAQYPSYGSNRIEVFTKPGGDKFHGGLYAVGNDAPFNANNPYTGAEPPYYSYYLDGHVSGPLLDKKTSFYADSTYHDMQNNSVVDAINPNSFGPLSESISAPDITNTYSVRVDRQMSANNTFTGRYDYNETQLRNAGVGLLVLPSEGYASTETYQTLQLGNTQTVTPQVVSETRFQYLRTRLRQNAEESAPTVVVEGSFNGGGSSVGALHDNQDRFEFQEYLSIEKGKHFVRAGARYDLLRDANESTANYNGTYTFPTLAAYQANAPTQFSLTAGQPNVALLTGWLGAYGEDEWKAAKNLTLDFGLRFESESAIPDHADWAPRAGFAWAVGQKDKKQPVVILRGGFGIFYERFQAGNILTAIRQNGVSQRSYFVQNPTICPTATNSLNLCAGQLDSTLTPPTPYTINPHLHAEYDEDASFSVERALGRKGTVTATYLWARGLHQYISENINAPLPGTYTPGDPASGVRPLGGNQNIYQFASDGIAKGQLFFVYANFKPAKRLNLWAFYRFQDERNNTSGATAFTSNSYDLRADYGRSGLLAKQQLYSGGNLDLPFKASLNAFLGAGSGIPFNITTGTDLNGDTIYNDRPAFATDLTRPSVVRTAYGTFDTAPIAGQKIIPVNYGNSPGYVTLELSASRTIAFGPRPVAPAMAGGAGTATAPGRRGDAPYALRFSVEADNVLNHVNPGQPVGVLNSPLFGRSISLNRVFSQLGAANRVVNLSARFEF